MNFNVYVFELMNIRSKGAPELKKQKYYNFYVLYVLVLYVVVRPCKKPTRRFSGRRKLLWRQNTRQWRGQPPLNMTETKWNGSLRCETYLICLVVCIFTDTRRIQFHYVKTTVSWYLLFCLRHSNCLLCLYTLFIYPDQP